MPCLHAGIQIMFASHVERKASSKHFRRNEIACLAYFKRWLQARIGLMTHARSHWRKLRTCVLGRLASVQRILKTFSHHLLLYATAVDFQRCRNTMLQLSSPSADRRMCATAEHLAGLRTGKVVCQLPDADSGLCNTRQRKAHLCLHFCKSELHSGRSCS